MVPSRCGENGSPVGLEGFVGPGDVVEASTPSWTPPGSTWKPCRGRGGRQAVRNPANGPLREGKAQRRIFEKSLWSDFGRS